MDFQEYQELRDGLLVGSESCQARARQWLKETRVPEFKSYRSAFSRNPFKNSPG